MGVGGLSLEVVRQSRREDRGWFAQWPIDSFGLSLLLGTVGLFDLRVLGVGKAVPPATLHKLIPFGIGDFVLNLLTGIWFFFDFPEQYFYNPSFQLLLAFVALAGINVAVFT